ncbi:hypothetical protein C1N61_32510 (plasmid) [Priestia aryabhattai]
MTEQTEILKKVIVNTPEELAVRFEYEKDPSKFGDFLIGSTNEDFYLTTRTWDNINEFSNGLYFTQGTLERLEIKSIPQELSHSSSSTNYLYRIISNELKFVAVSTYLEDDCTTNLFGTEYSINLKDNIVISSRLNRDVDSDLLETYQELYNAQQSLTNISIS